MRPIQRREGRNKSKNEENRNLGCHKTSTKERFIIQENSRAHGTEFKRNSSGASAAQNMSLGQVVLKTSIFTIQPFIVVLDERRFTVQTIARSFGIICGSVHTVLTEILEMTKLYARRLTTEDQLKKLTFARYF